MGAPRFKQISTAGQFVDRFGGDGLLGNVTFAANTNIAGINRYASVTINAGVTVDGINNRFTHLKCSSGPLTVGGSTTVALGSNGVNVNTFAGAGILNVVSTTGFASPSGTLSISTSNGTQTVTY